MRILRKLNKSLLIILKDSLVTVYLHFLKRMTKANIIPARDVCQDSTGDLALTTLAIYIMQDEFQGASRHPTLGMKMRNIELCGRKL